MGREEQLKQQQIRQAQANFASGVSNGQITIKDRFGHPLRTGDVVLLASPIPPMYQIADIQAVLDPRLPAGLVKVTLIAQDDQLLRPGMPIASLVFLPDVTAAYQKQTAESAGETGNSTGDTVPPPSAPPVEPPLGSPEGRPTGGVILTDDRFGTREG